MFGPDSEKSNPNFDHRSLCDIAQTSSEDSLSPSCASANTIAALKRAYLPRGGDDSLKGFRNQFGVFMPSRLEDVAAILTHTCADASKSFVDLGSGDGRVVLLAALGFRMNAVGYEQSERLIAVSRNMAQVLDVAASVEFKDTNFLLANLNHYDLVYYFDGGSLDTRYEGPRECPIPFFSSLATMKQGAELVVAYSHKLHHHLSRFDCFDLRETIATDPILPSRIYVRNACPCPDTWDKVFPSNLESDSK